MTDASSACSTARTNCWPWPAPCTSPISPRCRGRRSTDPTTSHWWRVRSPRAEDAERIREIRANSRRLITIGACASAGGIQALRNFAAEGAYVGAVYAHPEYISSLSTSTPISAHVTVDLEVQGCPIDRHQLLEVITAELAGRKPVIPTHTVCQECKGRGTVCLLVAPGRRAWVRSRGPDAEPCARPSAGAASVASDRPRGPTPTPWPAPARRRHGPRRRLTAVRHLLRRRTRCSVSRPGRCPGHGDRPRPKRVGKGDDATGRARSARCRWRGFAGGGRGFAPR